MCCAHTGGGGSRTSEAGGSTRQNMKDASSGLHARGQALQPQRDDSGSKQHTAFATNQLHQPDITKDYSTSDYGGGGGMQNKLAKIQPSTSQNITTTNHQEPLRSNKMLKTAYNKKTAALNGSSGAIASQPLQPFPMKVANINSMVQIRRKRPKMKFQDKIVHKAQQERQIYSQQVQYRESITKKNHYIFHKVLDGFLLLYSCRVKLPHEAIRSKLNGENIVDVREEDLVYFKQNLKFLDVSDNNIAIEQLVNLHSLEELDLQYNNLSRVDFSFLSLPPFPSLNTLHLSYNKIPPGHLLQLSLIPNLTRLEIASNDFCTLPSDISGFVNLEEFNLSSNCFSSESVLVQPGKLFAALASIPKLRKLNRQK